MAQCKSKKKNGERCGAKAGPGGKCATHSGKNRAKELGRKSAEARRQAKEEAQAAMCTNAPNSPEDLIRQMLDCFAALKNGKLDDNRARALATVSNSIMRGYEVVDVRKQLVEIEELLKQRT